jgi:hypothetical protein
VLNSAELYDPTTRTWTLASSMGQPRQGHTATLLPNGKVLVAAGTSYFETVYPTSAEMYDPATGKWSPTLPLVSGHLDHFTALLPGGKVLLAGGFNTTDTGPNSELFDPASVVATPALLSQPTIGPSGAIRFTFRNTPGLSFTVLSAANAGMPVNQWSIAGEAIESSPGHYQFSDSTLLPQSFYRVRSP